MSTGQILFLACVAGLLLVWLAQRVLVQRAQLPPGTPVPDLPALAGFQDGMLWFHSPGCAPCRAMKPGLQPFIDDGTVRAVDVTENPEVAAALSVMGTPTAMRIAHGQVTRVHLGAMSPGQVRDFLA